MRVTLKDIAERAELSVSTTSRALNNHPSISQKTTVKVRKIAGELRYQPVRSHRRPTPVSGLLAGRNIAIASLGLDRTLASMPVVSNAFHGAEEVLRDAGANVQIVHIPYLDQLSNELQPTQLDGLVLTGAMVEQFSTVACSSTINLLKNIPTVWMIGHPPGAWGDAVVADDFAIGSGAAEHLFAQGHRELAFLNPMPDNLLFARREDGFYAAARRLGASVQSFCEAPESGWPLPLRSPASVFDVVQHLIDRMVESRPRPTAVFASADSVAALVYCALGVRGLRIGHDISVIGGNNTPGLMTAPFANLATFDIHADQLGALAVRQLATQFSERRFNLRSTRMSESVATHLVVSPTFIPGESVQGLRREGILTSYKPRSRAL